MIKRTNVYQFANYHVMLTQLLKCFNELMDVLHFCCAFILMKSCLGIDWAYIEVLISNYLRSRYLALRKLY